MAKTITFVALLITPTSLWLAISVAQRCIWTLWCNWQRQQMECHLVVHQRVIQRLVQWFLAVCTRADIWHVLGQERPHLPVCTQELTHCSCLVVCRRLCVETAKQFVNVRLMRFEWNQSSKLGTSSKAFLQLTCSSYVFVRHCFALTHRQIVGFDAKLSVSFASHHFWLMTVTFSRFYVTKNSMFKLENTFVKQGLGRLVDPSDVECVLSWFILAARSARGIGFGAGDSAGWSTDARKVAVNTISASKWSPLAAATALKVPPFTVFNQLSKRSSLKSWPGLLTAKAKWPWCSDTCQIQSSNEFGGNLIFASSRLKVRTAIWKRCHLRKSP